MKKRWMGVLAVVFFPAAVSRAGWVPSFSIKRVTAMTIKPHVSLLGIFLLSAGAFGADYSITILPLPAGASYGEVGAVSPNGLVGGEVFIGNHDTLSGYMQPVVWQNGVAHLLPLPPGLGMSGEIRSINDNGDASGGTWQGPIPSGVNPVVWRNGQLQSLSKLGMDAGEPNSIDAAGNMVGAVANASGSIYYPASWSNGQASIITNLSGEQVVASSVNSHGDVLLIAVDDNKATSYVLSNGILTKIDGITADTAHGTDGAAINDSGQVVGTSLSSDGLFHGFLWQNGTTLDLGKLPGDLNSGAVAINASGEIVGTGYARDVGVQGLLWKNGQLFSLNDLLPPDSGWSQLNPAGIADDGSIAGTGVFNGEVAPFLLSPSATPSDTAPTPEPASAATLLLAAPVLLGRRRRSV